MKAREYFYHVSHLGGVYPIAGPAELAAPPFGPATVRGRPLDFLLRHVRPAAESERPDPRFAWVSLCGRERNWLHSASRTPIVFLALDGAELMYGDTLRLPFDASALAVNCRGELYHPGPDGLGYSLIRTHVVQEHLGSRIEVRYDTGAYLFDGLRMVELAD